MDDPPTNETLTRRRAPAISILNLRRHLPLASPSHSLSQFHAPEDGGLRAAALERKMEAVACPGRGAPGGGKSLSPAFFFQQIAASHVARHRQLRHREKRPGRRHAQSSSSTAEPAKPAVVVVGCIVRPSRLVSLARQRLLHLHVIDGICYVPGKILGEPKMPHFLLNQSVEDDCGLRLTGPSLSLLPPRLLRCGPAQSTTARALSSR